MNRKMGLLVSVLISILPFNTIRCTLYKIVFSYTIRNASIGFGTVIFASKVTLDNCSIGHFNRFLGPMSVFIGPHAKIESHNVFDCGEWAADAEHAERYDRTLVIERKTFITNHHFFDIAGKLSIGEGTWIAGRSSQFWTHGVNVTNRNIVIGENCYIGSAVRFAPGSGVGDNVIVGLGSILTKHIAESKVVVAGFPAKVIKDNRIWKYDISQSV